MDLLLALQSIRNPVLDRIMLGITYLGDETVLMIIGGILLWCVNKRRGIRTLLVCLSAMSVTTALKGLFAIPRPWIREPKLQPVDGAMSTAEDFSFPSGHATISSSAYGTILADVKAIGLRILCVIVMLSVVFTRLYLGVHTPEDVAVGVCIGLVFVAAGIVLRRYENNQRVMHLIEGGMTIVSFAVLLFLALTNGDLSNPAYYAVMKELSTISGALLGITVGCSLEVRYVNYETQTTLPFQVLKIAGGFAIVMILKTVLKSLFGAILPNCPYTDVVRYFILMMVVFVGWPMVFKKFPKVSK